MLNNMNQSKSLIKHPAMRILQYTFMFRASLGTLFFQGITIFPRENELIFLGKMKFPWEKCGFQTNLTLRVNLVPISITKDGYPNRISCFVQSLMHLDVEYYVARASNRHIDTTKMFDGVLAHFMTNWKLEVVEGP